MNPYLAKFRVHFFVGLLFLLYPLFFIIVKFKGQKDDEEDKGLRIMVIPQFTRVGDLVCATPVFKEIKEHYPESFLSVVVNPKASGIIESNPNIDKVFILNDREYLDFFGMFRRFRRIRGEHFDWSINLTASTMGTLMSVYGLIPNRVKITKKRRPFSEALTDWMNTHKQLYEEGEHIPTLYLKTLWPLKISVPTSIHKQVFTTIKGDEKVEHFFQENNIKKEKKIIGISVTAGNEIKEWSVERFGELMKRLIVRYDLHIVFVGTSKDKEKIARVNAYINNKGAVAAGAFTLEELPSLIKRLSVFISADTGIVHVAEALGVSLIDIVGPVDPYEQTPREGKSIIVKPQPDIKPTIFAFRPPGDPKESRRAADNITVDHVFTAFEKLYSESNA